MRKVKLEEVAEVFGGYAFKSKDFIGHSKTPVIKISSIQNGTVDSDNIADFLPDEYFDKYKRYEVKQGDILVPLSGATTGKTGVYRLKYPALLNQRVGLVRAKRGAISQKYLNYYVSKLTDEILQKAQGVAQPNISTKELSKFEIPLPTLEEQKAIVAKLDRAQRLIDIDRAMLAKYDELIQSVFLEMFGDPAINNKGFDKAAIEDLVTKVKRENPKKTDKTYSYISISDVDNTKKEIVNWKKVDAQNAPSRARQLLKKDDILVSTVRPNLNAVAILKSNLTNPIGSTGFCILRSKKDIVNPHYLFEVTRSRYFVSELVLVANGASYPAVTDKDILDLEIPVPSIDIQDEFENRIKDIRKETDLTTLLQSRSRELFSSLLKEAFS